jgi:hypothetical protein
VLVAVVEGAGVGVALEALSLVEGDSVVAAPAVVDFGEEPRLSFL